MSHFEELNNNNSISNNNDSSSGSEDKVKHHKVIIIGSGPAGLTAALYTSRANLFPLLFEGNESGGQLVITTTVENYPGFVEPILGYDLIENMKKQAQKFGTTYVSEHVTKVNFKTKPFVIISNKNIKYTADSIIIATGASARYLGLKNEARLIGHGVSGCATCDGFFFKGKEIAVVGGGDSAMEEASFLTKFASKVTIIHRKDSFRASKIMQQRVFNNPKIDYLWNTIVLDVIGDEKKGVEGLMVKNTITGEEKQFPVQGLFLGIGHNPNTEVFKNELELDEQGYIKVQPGTVSTKIPGIFACGDVQDLKYKQAITAAGTGCMAAMDVEKYLETLHTFQQ